MTATAKGNRIDEELVCVDSLVHFLKQVCGHQEVQVKRETDDPPDFWLHIDGKRFAAEVTSIVTDQGYLSLCRKLKQSIQEKAQEFGNLNGIYALIIERNPNLPKRTSSDWQRLVDIVVSFIAATREASSTEISYLQEDSYGRLGVQKTSDKGTAVGLWGFSGFKWEGEAQEELTALIQDAVTIKRSKLEKKNIPQQCPDAILLLYDAYGYGDAEDAREALRKVQGYDWFHSVFWAASFTDRDNKLSPENPGRIGSFLYSKEDGWCKET